MRVILPSVAPVDMVATTGSGPHIAETVRSIAVVSSGVSGDGGTATAGTSEPSAAWTGTGVMVTFGSAITRCSVARTCSGFSPGKIPQLTFARAVCGSAFGAWPPESMVATQVVRKTAL